MLQGSGSDCGRGERKCGGQERNLKPHCPGRAEAARTQEEEEDNMDASAAMEEVRRFLFRDTSRCGGQRAIRLLDVASPPAGGDTFPSASFRYVDMIYQRFTSISSFYYC